MGGEGTGKGLPTTVNRREEKKHAGQIRIYKTRVSLGLAFQREDIYIDIPKVIEVEAVVQHVHAKVTPAENNTA